MTQDMDNAVEFARAMELPDIDDLFLGIESTESLVPPDFETPELAITVGSQIASFATEIDGELRKKIANAFLFAQQAADKQIEKSGSDSSEEWYKTYTDVLSRIGWIREDATLTIRKISGTSSKVHEAIIPIVELALGPVGAAAAIVSVLKGLQEMNSGKPWITLFESSSQRAQANQFQVSHIEEAAGKPRLTLVNFELDAQRSISQVLFFKLSTDSAELRHFETKMSVNEEIFSSVAPIISQRLEDRISDLVTQIDI